MTTTTFQWNGATLTIHKAKVRDRLTSDVLHGRLFRLLGPDSAMNGMFRSAFARVFTQIDSCEGSLGFPLVNVASPDSDLLEAYNAFLDADAELYDSVIAALEILQAPPNVTNLLPPDLVPEAESDDEKKAVS